MQFCNSSTQVGGAEDVQVEEYENATCMFLLSTAAFSPAKCHELGKDSEAVQLVRRHP